LVLRKILFVLYVKFFNESATEFDNRVIFDKRPLAQDEVFDFFHHINFAFRFTDLFGFGKVKHPRMLKDFIRRKSL